MIQNYLFVSPIMAMLSGASMSKVDWLTDNCNIYGQFVHQVFH